MKIGILSNLFPPYARGGAERVALTGAEGLLARGHEVFVVTTMPYNGSASRNATAEIMDGVTVYRFCPRNFYHLLQARRIPAPLRIPWHLVDSWSRHPAKVLARVMASEKPDAVISHNLKGLGLQVAATLRQQGVFHLHTLHDFQLSIPSGILFYGQEETWPNNSYLRRWYEGQTQKALGSPEVVVAPSAFLVDYMRQRGFFPASRIEVLPNPAPESGAKPRGARKPGNLRLLFAGQLEPHKGIDLLLGAARRIDKPVEIHFAGQGSLSKTVAEQAARDPLIHHHGSLPFPKLAELFLLCDALVLPSLWHENSPMVIYESFQAGLPVIAADLGGIGELVLTGQRGILFKPGDEAALCHAISALVAEPEMFAGRQQELRDFAKKLERPRYVDRLLELLPSQPLR